MHLAAITLLVVGSVLPGVAGQGSAACTHPDSGPLAGPCLNGGICESLFGQLTCSCPDGFDGHHCETPPLYGAVCTPLCRNGGTCQSVFGATHCTCPSGFGGDTCETKSPPPPPPQACTPPCLNGGTCASVFETSHCTCTPGFEGETCEAPAAPAGGGSGGLDDISCTLGGHPGAADLRPCLNGGTCESLFGDTQCDCAGGFTGHHCETPGSSSDGGGEDETSCTHLGERPCRNGGVCTEVFGQHQCSCTGGFGGDHCETPQAVQATCQAAATANGGNACHNGGTCVDLFGSYECRCAAGFSGASCGTDDSAAPSPDAGCSTITCELFSFAAWSFLFFLNLSKHFSSFSTAFLSLCHGAFLGSLYILLSLKNSAFRSGRPERRPVRC